MIEATSFASPGWLKIYRLSFAAAAIYNVIWGLVVIFLPSMTLRLANVETDQVGILFWQCIGMFVMVFAIGYAAAWRDPSRFAVFILIALLGKIFGPIGFVYGAFVLDALPASLGWTIITNDLIWWPIWGPFVWQFVLVPFINGQQQEQAIS
ncbi:MAG: alkyl hydroperoxide reductase [Planctomycetota bacterium]